MIGDSISESHKWPSKLARIVGCHTFSQAIGGTRSPSMVGRARGVELASSLAGAPAQGHLRLRWHRHCADLTQDESSRARWASLAKLVSEPDSIEIYLNDQFAGLATRKLVKFTTDYAIQPKTIFAPFHGLKNGDRVAFVSTDPNWPANISTLDTTRWSYSSPNLPGSIVEKRVYFAAQVTRDDFQIKEFANATESLNLSNDATGTNFVECGWFADIEVASADAEISWKSRTQNDDSIWVLEVSANDFPATTAVESSIPNTGLLLDQMIEIHPRYVILCPPSGSHESRGPGSFSWMNYYDQYMPWVRSAHPDNHIDTMTLLQSFRSKEERLLLTNPEVPELLWIAGTPTDPASWVASVTQFTGASRMWVGPGYTPLQLRNKFSDGIHLNSTGDQVLANAVAEFLKVKGWWSP